MPQIPMIPVMDYRQYRKMRRLVHSCCNYDSDNCLALDDGEKCVCVQSISYSLLCRCHEAQKRRCTQEETVAEVSRFRR